MVHIPIDPRTGQAITPAFGELVDTVLAEVRRWTARRRAAAAERRAARVARELDVLPDAVLKRLGLDRRGEPT